MSLEVSFPRGGKVKPKREFEEDDLSHVNYGVRTDKQEKKVKPSKKQRKARKKQLANEETAELITSVVEIVNKNTIAESMLILGVVRSISATQLRVTLPGHLGGKISATAISNSYTKLIQGLVDDPSTNVKPLNEIFNPGQQIVVKVISTETDEDHLLQLSANPSDINADRLHHTIQQGQNLVGAVAEIEDHGFLIETGIKNVRAFLPKEKVKGKPTVGELVYCIVEQAETTTAATTVILKALKRNEFGQQQLEVDPNLDTIAPGTIVPFTLDKILKNGLHGRMCDSFLAYVHENYLTEPLHRPDDYTMGLTFDARLLYVAPLTKHAFLSLCFEPVRLPGEKGTLAVGDIVEKATSMGKGSGGVILKLGKGAKGVILAKEIRRRYEGNYDKQTAFMQYAKSTKHRVRVLSYDIVERIYLCTDNEKMLEEPYFTISDLQVGDLVQARVVFLLKEGGCVVKIGNVRAYLEKFYYAPSPKVKKGAIIKVRIVCINLTAEKVHVSNRSEFLKTKQILKDVSQLESNAIFTGLIIKELPNIYIVRFFNQIRGILYKNNTGLVLDAKTLHPGAIFNFRIFSVSGEKPVLRVATNLDESGALGIVSKAKVECVFPTGVQIRIKRLNLTGTVPKGCLSDFPALAELRLEAVKEEEKMKVANLASQVYSLRDVEYFEAAPPLTYADVRVGDVLKATVKAFEGGIVELTVPLRNFWKTVKLHVSSIVSHETDEVEIVPDQVLYVRVEGKMEGVEPTLILSARLSDVWNGDPNTSAELLDRYFQDLDAIRGKFNGKGIGKYEAGQKVSGTVSEIFQEHKIVILKLGNDVSGVCQNIPNPQDYQLGQKVEGKVLWVNYVHKTVELTINRQTMDRISDNQKVNQALFKEKPKYKGYVVLVRDDIIIVSIGEKGPLIYLSPRFHFNDLQPSMIKTLANYGGCSIQLIKEVQGRIVGMFEENFKHCQALMKFSEENRIKRMRKSSENETEDEKSTVEAEANGTEVESKVETAEIETEVMDKLAMRIKKKLKRLQKGAKAIPTSKKVKKKFEKAPKKANKLQKKLESMFKDTQLDGVVDKKAPKSKKKKNKKPKYAPGAFVRAPKEEDIEEPPTLKRKSPSPDPPQPAKKRLLQVEIKKSLHKAPAPIKKDVTALPGTFGFWFTPEPPSVDDPSSSDDDQSQTTSKPSKKSSKTNPQTPRDFDRLLIHDPNNASIWLRYIDLHMRAFEIEKARGVGERALKAIDVREEREKLRVWLALIRIEIEHGTNETFNKLFREATQRNNPLRVFRPTLQTLIEADKRAEVNGLLGVMMKKYKPHAEMWEIAAETYYKLGATDRPPAVLEKAKLSLPKEEHIPLTIKFALLSNQFRQREYAQTLFENILTKHPQRTDIWSQYVDLLIKDKDYDNARLVLDRAIVQKMSPKKMKTLFQKYSDFEEKFGTAEQRQRVKEMAEEYVKKVAKDVE